MVHGVSCSFTFEFYNTTLFLKAMSILNQFEEFLNLTLVI